MAFFGITHRRHGFIATRPRSNRRSLQAVSHFENVSDRSDPGLSIEPWDDLLRQLSASYHPE
jgi:hypothetical protein